MLFILTTDFVQQIAELFKGSVVYFHLSIKELLTTNVPGKNQQMEKHGAPPRLVKF